MTATTPSDDASSAPAPRTVAQLLRHLGASRSPVTRQRQALAHWLTHHTPGDELTLSFRVNGYGLLLGRPTTARGPVRARRAHD